MSTSSRMLPDAPPRLRAVERTRRYENDGRPDTRLEGDPDKALDDAILAAKQRSEKLAAKMDLQRLELEKARRFPNQISLHDQSLGKRAESDVICSSKEDTDQVPLERGLQAEFLVTATRTRRNQSNRAIDSESRDATVGLESQPRSAETPHEEPIHNSSNALHSPVRAVRSSFGKGPLGRKDVFQPASQRPHIEVILCRDIPSFSTNLISAVGFTLQQDSRHVHSQRICLSNSCLVQLNSGAHISLPVQVLLDSGTTISPGIAHGRAETVPYKVAVVEDTTIEITASIAQKVKQNRHIDVSFDIQSGKYMASFARGTSFRICPEDFIFNISPCLAPSPKDLHKFSMTKPIDKPRPAEASQSLIGGIASVTKWMFLESVALISVGFYVCGWIWRVIPYRRGLVMLLLLYYCGPRLLRMLASSLLLRYIPSVVLDTSNSLIVDASTKLHLLQDLVRSSAFSTSRYLVEGTGFAIISVAQLTSAAQSKALLLQDKAQVLICMSPLFSTTALCMAGIPPPRKEHSPPKHSPPFEGMSSIHDGIQRILDNGGIITRYPDQLRFASLGFHEISNHVRFSKISSRAAICSELDKFDKTAADTATSVHDFFSDIIDLASSVNIMNQYTCQDLESILAEKKSRQSQMFWNLIFNTYERDLKAISKTWNQWIDRFEHDINGIIATAPAILAQVETLEKALKIASELLTKEGVDMTDEHEILSLAEMDRWYNSWRWWEDRALKPRSSTPRARQLADVKVQITMLQNHFRMLQQVLRMLVPLISDLKRMQTSVTKMRKAIALRPFQEEIGMRLEAQIAKLRSVVPSLEATLTRVSDRTKKDAVAYKDAAMKGTSWEGDMMVKLDEMAEDGDPDI